MDGMDENVIPDLVSMGSVITVGDYELRAPEQEGDLTIDGERITGGAFLLEALIRITAERDSLVFAVREVLPAIEATHGMAYVAGRLRTALR